MSKAKKKQGRVVGFLAAAVLPLCFTVLYAAGPAAFAIVTTNELDPLGGFPPTSPAPANFEADPLAVTGGSDNSVTTGPSNLRVSLPNPLKASSLYEFLRGILDTVVAIGSVIVIFFIIYAGFLFVTARGDESQLKTAKKAFLWTFIGAAVLLGAFTLTQVIEGTINQLRGSS